MADDQTLEDRMVPTITAALRNILMTFESDQHTEFSSNEEILEAVARAAWREFCRHCNAVSVVRQN